MVAVITKVRSSVVDSIIRRHMLMERGESPVTTTTSRLIRVADEKFELVSMRKDASYLILPRFTQRGKVDGNQKRKRM